MGCSNSMGVDHAEQGLVARGGLVEPVQADDLPLLLRSPSGALSPERKVRPAGEMKRVRPAGKSRFGMSELHHLASKGDVQQLQNFFVPGVAVNVRSKDYQTTPLHMAASGGHVKAVQALLAAGADVHSNDIHRCTPLMYAVEFGHEGTARALLAAGAQVNGRDMIDSTVLHYCAQRSHTKLAQILLDAGADLHAKNAAGYTAYAMAEDWGTAEMKNFLLEQGGYR
mmetsp:Transcript_90803/g.166646  ORF Transcript_90803/g.166646 Transcript_90803/m.166646 type:complete len:226 (+) Transcript_90803:81-758(+)